MKKDDYYELLGVTKESGAEEIKKAYRKKAIQYHPDKNSGDIKAEEMFKKISEAYEVLSDPTKKDNYDNGFSRFSYNASMNPNDIFSSAFGNMSFNGTNFNFSNMSFSFEDLMGSNFSRKAPRIPPDNKAVYRATMQDIINGNNIELQIKRHIACDKCNGIGINTTSEKCEACQGQGKRNSRTANMIFSSICNNCGGTGKNNKKCETCNGSAYSVVTENVNLKIPMGISPMSTLRLKGKGNEVYGGGVKNVGDTYIVIDYPQQYKGVNLKDGNFYISIRVPFNAALSEEEIEVDILGCKKVTLKLNSEHKSGYLYVVEKGGINENNYAFVKVFIDFPKNKISKEDKLKLISVMKEIYGLPTNKFRPEETIGDS